MTCRLNLIILYRHSSVNHKIKVLSQPIVRSVNSEHYKQTLDVTKQAIVYNMILPLMNITVIPLLLGAIGSVENHAEWNFGPEYTFQLNKTIAVIMDFFVTESLAATIKCRPNELSQSMFRSVLFCRVHRLISSNTTRRIFGNINKQDAHNTRSHETEIHKPGENQFFELEFGIQGVQSFRMNEQSLDSHVYDVASDVIEQFNVGINLSVEARHNLKYTEDQTSAPHLINSFKQTDNGTVKASKCNTSFTITYVGPNDYHRDGGNRDKNKTKYNFQLSLLPIPYTNQPDDSLSIERIKTACPNLRKNIICLDEKWNIEDTIKYQNVIKVQDTKPKFTSYSILEGHALLSRFNRRMKHYFWENVHLELLDIKPAQHEFRTYA